MNVGLTDFFFVFFFFPAKTKALLSEGASAPEKLNA